MKRIGRKLSLGALLLELALVSGRARAATNAPETRTGQGMEEHFLKGLQFDLGTGFAPHPLFASWVEQQIQAGIAALGTTRTDAALSP